MKKVLDALGMMLNMLVSLQEEFWNDPNTAIRRAYDKTDKEILSHSRDLGRGGSTAVTAMLVNGSTLWVANVGDSRAVLAKHGKVIQLSTDHEPNSERESIEMRGGFVSNIPGLSISSERNIIYPGTVVIFFCLLEDEFLETNLEMMISAKGFSNRSMRIDATDKVEIRIVQTSSEA